MRTFLSGRLGTGREESEAPSRYLNPFVFLSEGESEGWRGELA